MSSVWVVQSPNGAPAQESGLGAGSDVLGGGRAGVRA